jgi:D-alanyl-D-alanine carboxypeptidase
MTRARALPLLLAFILTGCVSTTPAHSEIPAPTQKPSATTALTPVPIPAPTVATFDTTLHSIDEANSLWVIVDKLRRLTPKRYVPSGLKTLSVPHTYSPTLRNDAAKAYLKMYRAAKKDGVNLVFQSGYRSYSVQVSVYNGWVASLGRKAADLQSARPGYSEHQTGLSVDIASATGGCTIQSCFAKTREGKWLSKNAWRFGWHLRYPKGKTSITGYKFEPWHWRYVGKELAAELHLTPKITMEEFFGLPAAPDYAR